MKFRFLRFFFLLSLMAFGQQSPTVSDSLVLPRLDAKKDSLSLPLQRVEVSKTVTDSSRVVQDTLTVATDSLGGIKAKDSLKVASSKKKKNIRKAKRRQILIDTTALINNYKVYFEDGREEIIDTSLTIEKEYKFNFLRRDYFELLPLSNVAEGFNRMGYDYLNQPLGPRLGARINQYGFFESEDIPYFEVATPLTELFFRTTFEQGELVDALVTVNPSSKFNFMVSYKGLRSLGRYQSSRANGGQFRSSIQFNDAQERYRMRAHFVAQTRENQVNGGLSDFGVYLFENAPNYPEIDDQGNPVLDENGEVVEVFYDGYLDRSRLPNNFRADSKLSGRRFYIGQTYAVKATPSDTLRQPLQLSNRFTYETRFYEFDQSSVRSTNFFGAVDDNAEKVFDRMDVATLTNETHAIAQLGALGTVKAGVVFNRWDFAHGRSASTTATSYLGQKVNQLALDARWEKKYGRWQLTGKGYHSLLEKLKTHHYEIATASTFYDNWGMSMGMQYRSQPQNFNFYQYESEYIDLNWDHANDWKNTNRFSLQAELSHKRWFRLSAEWHHIDNYSYFRNITRLAQWGESLTITPFQSEDRLEYLKLRWYNHLPVGKFSLTNTVQYQKVNQIEADRPTGALGEPLLLNVPEWIVRSTFAFSSDIFKKALFLQTGVHFQFFTGYYADAIHSVLGEYVTQNNQLIGEYPRIDFFVNAKISQTRLYFKVEHLNNSLTGYRYYSAPFFPYRDLSIRFGLVWNFFQ